ncbi:hypothetical protein [Streptomyces sp. 2A115]|uniref:hypothetical protein n=1 Tax=Streptomyces sp. 2A115 TaxID=3457439 RepID=UPI003FD0CEB1
MITNRGAHLILAASAWISIGMLVSGCTEPECEPFKLRVTEVIATIQRDGSYSLEPAPVRPAPNGGTGYVMPQELG